MESFALSHQTSTLSYTLINVNPFSCLCVMRHKTAKIPKEAVCPAPVAHAQKPRSQSYKFQPFFMSLRACVPASVTNIHT